MKHFFCPFGCFFGNNNEVSKDFLINTNKLLSSEITHRGPDDNSFWSDEDENVYFAHNRLKIIDLTFSGNQPMFSYSDNLVIVYNGEIYNTEKLIQKYDFLSKDRSNSDTIILIELISNIGFEKTISDTFINIF